MLLFNGKAAGFPLSALAENGPAVARLASLGVDYLTISRDTQARAFSELGEFLDRVSARVPGLRPEPVRFMTYIDRLDISHLMFSRHAGSQLRVTLTMRPMAWAYGVRAKGDAEWGVWDHNGSIREHGDLDERDPFRCEIVTREERAALLAEFPPGPFDPEAFLGRLASIVAEQVSVCPSCGQVYRGVKSHIHERVLAERDHGSPGMHCALALGYVLSHRKFREWGVPSLKTVGIRHAASATPLFEVEYRPANVKKTRGKVPPVTLYAWPKYLYTAAGVFQGKHLTVAAENYFQAMRDCPEVPALFAELAGKDLDHDDVRAMTEYINSELKAAGKKPRRVVERKVKPKPAPDFTWRAS